MSKLMKSLKKPVSVGQFIRLERAVSDLSDKVEEMAKSQREMRSENKRMLGEILNTLLVMKKKEERKEGYYFPRDHFANLPYRTALSILQEWYQFSVMDEEDVTDIVQFFGRFKKDKFGKVYCLFKSIYFFEGCMLNNSTLPVSKLVPVRKIVHVEFNYVFYSYVAPSFLQNCHSLRSIQRVIWEDHLRKNKMIQELERFTFAFDISNVNNLLIKFVNSMPNLYYLGFRNTGKGKCCVEKIDLESPKLTNMYFSGFLPSSFTFKKQKQIRYIQMNNNCRITDKQVANLSSSLKLREVLVRECTFQGGVNPLLESKHIKELLISCCSFNIPKLKDVIIPKESNLRYVQFEGVKNIPFTFFVQLFENAAKLKNLIIYYSNLKDTFLDFLLKIGKTKLVRKRLTLLISSNEHVFQKSLLKEVATDGLFDLSVS